MDYVHNKNLDYVQHSLLDNAKNEFTRCFVGLILFVITSVFFLAFSMYWPKVLSEGVGLRLAVTVFQGLSVGSSNMKKETVPS